LVQAGCKELEEIVQGYEKEKIKCFENLKYALEKQSMFYQYISTKGYTQNNSPVHWILTPLESQLLFGGNNNPSLEFFITQRKSVWNLK